MPSTDRRRDIIWLVAEHLHNMTNIGLNIGSDLCELRPAQRGTIDVDPAQRGTVRG